MKKNEPFISTITDVRAAELSLEANELAIERLTKAIKFSLVAMAFYWGGALLSDLFKNILVLAVAAQLVAVVGFIGFIYCIYLGGFSTVVKGAGKIAKWGWFLVPFFPMDIFVAIGVFFVILGVFFTMPALFYLTIRSSLKKENAELKTYIERYKNDPQHIVVE